MPAAGKSAGSWSISTTTHHDLADLVTHGFLPHSSILLWRPALPVDDVSNPDNWNRVVHTSFLCRGLSLPLHSFLRGLLHFYGWQFHHITPNGVPHLACFLMLCECLLGILPDFELWRYFFEVKLHWENGEVLDCGGAIIRHRADAGYFHIPMLRMTTSWQHGWFYAPDLPKEITKAGLTPFENSPPQERPSWSAETELLSIEVSLRKRMPNMLQLFSYLSLSCHV